MQIILFFVIIAFTLIVVGLMILGVIGAHVMRFVMWVKGLFRHSDSQYAEKSDQHGSKPQDGKVIGDDEGEYVDFEEVRS